MNCTLGGGTEADMVFAIRELTGGLDGGKIEIQPNEALIGASPDKGRQEGGGRYGAGQRGLGRGKSRGKVQSQQGLGQLRKSSSVELEVERVGAGGAESEVGGGDTAVRKSS